MIDFATWFNEVPLRIALFFFLVGTLCFLGYAVEPSQVLAVLGIWAGIAGYWFCWEQWELEEKNECDQAIV